MPNSLYHNIKTSGVASICCEEGQSCKLGHGTLTANIRASCSAAAGDDRFVTNAVLIERAVSCWHLHQLMSQTTQYLDSWLSYLLKSELKMKLLEVEGRGHVPQCPIAGDATDNNISTIITVPAKYHINQKCIIPPENVISRVTVISIC